MSASARPTPSPEPAPRPILTAELLAVGSELTVGDTTDTNSGEIARALTALGITVLRVSDLPDDLDVVTRAVTTALEHADLVVTTGGLGPTPDDLTREAVAAACGEDPAVDPATLSWLEGLWARRNQPFPAANVKQAWLIPSATSLPNPNGTAPGWWVDRPDGRAIVMLPGPPREMRPMWHEQVLPRLTERGAGADLEVRTLRLHGIGESQVADLLDEVLRASNPQVATYARAEAVDVRISARPEDDGRRRGRSAVELADEAEARVLAAVGPYVWARGATTWGRAIEDALATRGWTIATVERGTGGAVVALLGDLGSRLRAEVLGAAATTVDASATDDTREAERVRTEAGADVGFAVRCEPLGDEIAVDVAVATRAGARAERRIAFARGGLGRERAAIAAAAVLLAALRAPEAER